MKINNFTRANGDYLFKPNLNSEKRQCGTILFFPWQICKEAKHDRPSEVRYRPRQWGNIGLVSVYFFSVTWKFVSKYANLEFKSWDLREHATKLLHNNLQGVHEVPLQLIPYYIR